MGMATHVVGLIGYAYLNEMPVLVFEYCEKGDLLSVIRDSLADYKGCIRAVTESGSRKECLLIIDHGGAADEALLQYRPLFNGPRLLCMADQRRNGKVSKKTNSVATPKIEGLLYGAYAACRYALRLVSVKYVLLYVLFPSEASQDTSDICRK